MGCGQLEAERVKVALVKPGDSMEATRTLRSPWAALGTSGETARLKDWMVPAADEASSARETSTFKP